jgi:hypothetical protein
MRRGSRRLAAAGTFLGLLLLLPGCALEAPQRPSFDTVLNIPLAEEFYTGQQLAEGAGPGGQPMSEGPRAADAHCGIRRLQNPVKLVLETARQEGDPFEIDTDAAIRAQIVLSLQEVVITVEAENHFATGVDLKLHFARSAEALFVQDELVIGSDAIAPAAVDTVTTRVAAPAESRIRIEVTDPMDLHVFSAERLFGALEIALVGDGEQSLEIWSTDYLKVGGMVSFRYRVE